jgi:hypothetical protein
VRHLVQAVTDACDGHVLDDATVLCLDWYGPLTTDPAPAVVGA